MTSWIWRPNARLDMPALVWSPGSCDRGSSLSIESETEREKREQRRAWRARNAGARLVAMQAHGAVGYRAGGIVRHVYGERGEELNRRESSAEAVVKRHGFAPDEKDRKRFARELSAYRDRFRSRNPQLGAKTVDEMVPLSFGNALIAWATDAYEHDEWTEIVRVERENENDERETITRFCARVDSETRLLDAQLARLEGRVIGRIVRRAYDSAVNHGECRE